MDDNRSKYDYLKSAKVNEENYVLVRLIDYNSLLPIST